MKEIVIKIPDDYNVSMGAEVLIDAVIDGVELPKGHGRLIDIDALTKDFNTFQDSFLVNTKAMNSGTLYIACTAPIVIEADKED